MEACWGREARDVGPSRALGARMVAGGKGKPGWACQGVSHRTAGERQQIEGVLSLVLSPTVVRKPPSESCSGSIAFSPARTPTSVFEETPGFWSLTVHAPGGGASCWKVVRTNDCDIAS